MVHTQDAQVPCGTATSDFADEVICDEKGYIANWLGVKDQLPAAFLWNWQGALKVRNGHFDEVERAITAHFREQRRIQVEAVDTDGTSDDGLRELVRTELARSGKFLVVATEEERKQAAALRKESFKGNYDRSSRCQLGKELPANSILKVRPQASSLSFQLFSVEQGCMVQAASVPYRKGLELVAVSEGVSALLSQVRLTEYELPQGKAKSQFGIALEPVFVPEIDQAPVFTPAGGNFGTVDVGFLETFEVAVKVDRRKGATEKEKAKAWRQVAQYPTREYQEERRQAAERARGYRKIIDARKRERAQLLEVRRRYKEDRAKLARLMKLEMVDEAQKSEFAREFETAYAAWLPRLEAMEARDAASVQAAQEEQARKAEAAEEARLAALPPTTYEVFGYDLGYGFGSLDGVEIQFMSFGFSSLWFEGRGLGFLFGVGGEVAYVIDASEDTFTEDYSRMALPGYLAMGAGFDTGDVALTLYGKGGYDFYFDSLDDGRRRLADRNGESPVWVSVAAGVLIDGISMDVEYVFSGLTVPTFIFSGSLAME